MANLAAETDATAEEKRQPSPNSSNVGEDCKVSAKAPSFVPPPRMANLNAERQTQQQKHLLYDPTKGWRRSIEF